jgi:hypothetical protein
MHPFQQAISLAQHEALSHWVLRLGGRPTLVRALVARQGAASTDAPRLLEELAGLERDFRTRENRLLSRHDGGVNAAYRALGVHALSDWEASEIEIERNVQRGAYDSGALPPGATDTDLFLMVVHGHFAKARPLLLRFADEHPGTVRSLWSRWLANDTLDVIEAYRLAEHACQPPPGPAGLAATFSVTEHLPLAFVGGDIARAESHLTACTAAKEREFSRKPVKSLPRLLSQLIGFWRGEVAPEVLRMSFGNWFGYCYHHESPSNVREKIGTAFLFGRALDEGKSAHQLVEGIKAHLSMFSPERRAKRAVLVADVAPLMQALEALRSAVTRRGGLCVVAEGAQVRYVAEPPHHSGDFF